MTTQENQNKFEATFKKAISSATNDLKEIEEVLAEFKAAGFKVSNKKLKVFHSVHSASIHVFVTKNKFFEKERYTLVYIDKGYTNDMEKFNDKDFAAEYACLLFSNKESLIEILNNLLLSNRVKKLINLLF